MDEDILSLEKRIVPKYLCSRCSKVVKAKRVLPASKVFGQFFLVKENSITYYKLIAKNAHSAIQDIETNNLLRGNNSIVQLGPTRRRWKVRKAKKNWLLGSDMALSIRTRFPAKKRRINDKVLVPEKLSEPSEIKTGVSSQDECNNGIERRRQEQPA